MANVRKDNYNINIMENFPMDIKIGPKVRLKLQNQPSHLTQILVIRNN